METLSKLTVLTQSQDEKPMILEITNLQELS